MLQRIAWRKNFSHNRTEATRESGFTLLELLVVLAILGLLVAFVAPAALRQLGSAKHKIAEQSITRIVGILDLYRLDVRILSDDRAGSAALATRPDGVTGWNGPYVKDADDLKDPGAGLIFIAAQASVPTRHSTSCHWAPTASRVARARTPISSTNDRRGIAGHAHGATSPRSQGETS